MIKPLVSESCKEIAVQCKLLSLISWNSVKFAVLFFLIKY